MAGQMSMLIGGFLHETNTFVPKPTGLEEFTLSRVYRGDELRSLSGSNTVIGGMVDEIDRQGTIQPVWTASAAATPGGLVTTEAIEWFLGEILPAIADARPDAIVLDLHGAMVTEEHDDGDGYVLRRVREAAGPATPVVAVLDLHANIGPEMVANATALIPYDTYPHIDTAERGAEAVRMAAAAVRGEIAPVMRTQRIPAITPCPKQYSGVEPTASIMRHVHEVEERPGLLTASLCFAFGYADCPFAGMTAIVVADGDADLAAAAASEIADFVWERREEFRPDALTVEEAVHHAMQAERGPVVLADLGDNPGGGSAADGTALLWGLLDLGAVDAAFAVIADPEVVELAHNVGVGGRLETTLGGKTDDLHGYPIPITATVQSLSDGRFVYAGPMERGRPDTLGRTAVLACQGRYGDPVEVVVTTRRIQPLDVNVFRSQGIEPEEKAILGVKSAVHFRGSFTPVASEIVEVDTPGLTSIDFTRFSYQRLSRPIWPLDAI